MRPGTLCVLVVDDDFAIKVVVTAMLEVLGCLALQTFQYARGSPVDQPIRVTVIQLMCSLGAERFNPEPGA